MTKAEELLLKCGFEFDKDLSKNDTLLYRAYNYFYSFIGFSLEDKEIFTLKVFARFEISIDLLNAITARAKELGFIKEYESNEVKR